MGKTAILNRMCAAVAMLALCAVFAARLPDWYRGEFGKLTEEIESRFATPPKEDALKQLYWRYLNFTGIRLVNEVIILNDGRLLRAAELNPLIDERVEVISELNDYLGAKGVPFLFMRVPNAIRDNSELPRGIVYDVIADGDLFMSKLDERGVDTIDYRKLMTDKYADFAEPFYWGDHHWRPETALWAYGELGTILNDKYGFALNEKTWNPQEFESLIYRNSFVGKNSERVGSLKEDFTFLKPRFQTEFFISAPLTDETLRYGDFTDVFISAVKNKDLSVCNYSQLNRFYEGFVRYENLTDWCADVKVLLIGDSIFIPYATYLANSVRSLDCLYLQATKNGDAYPMIETGGYDLVLYLAQEGTMMAQGNFIEGDHTLIETDRMYLGTPPVSTP